MILKIWNHPWTLWVILALPSLPFLRTALAGASVHRSLHPTGEFAARLMIVAMVLTPLGMLFPKARMIRWLVRRRRYFGVAAFGYAALHTIFYFMDTGSFSEVLSDVFKLGIWTGWIAFLIFLAMASTSNDASVRKLGKNWKRLQRLVYVAAVATLLHWIFIENHLGPALVNFVPLALLESYRIWRTLKSRRVKPASARA